MFSTLGDLLVTGRRQCRQLVLAALITLVAGAAHAGYTTTRYPIVLMHGMSGFDQVGAVDYFTAFRSRCVTAVRAYSWRRFPRSTVRAAGRAVAATGAQRTGHHRRAKRSI